MKSWKRVIKWVILLGYFPIILSFVTVSQRATICSDIQVVVKDSMEMRFISKQEIRTMLLNNYPKLLGYEINKFDFDEIESFVENHHTINKCEVFNTKNGVLHIQVEQHKPILRVFTDRETFYLERDGYRIPVSKNFASNTLVVNGTIPSNYDDLLNVGRLINDDDFWKSQIEQIYIRKNNEYILIPRVGDHWILLGKPIDVDRKLSKLRALYKNGLLPHEWNKYKLINLKYENQVICSKNRDI